MSALQPQEIYSKVIVKSTSQQFEKINEAIGFDHVHLEKDGSFTGEFSKGEIAEMIKLGAKVKYLIPDVIKDLTKNNNKRQINNSLSDLAPAGFTYGSMGGYLTYAEIVTKLDQLRTMYPNLISQKFSIGKSTENRDLWVVRISNNPDVDQNSKPKVFFNALTHAREPAGMMQLIYYMCTLLQNYNTDPEVKHLVDNREIYFMPCVNPDGYEYNRSTNPNGGGMWRKNRYKECTVTTTVSNCRDIKVRRCDTVWNAAHTSYTLKNCKDIKIGRICDTTRTTNCTVYGVDLNRNYSYKWAYDNTGSSSTKTSSTYRGPSAFSEPETKAIRDFSYLKNFKMVMNQHTPGNQLVYPYSYANVVDPNQALYDKRNTLLTETNGLLIGHMKTTAGYFANGESSDWQYGEVTAKPKAFSWTPELGESFWPAQSLIETLCIRMLRTDLNMTWIAGAYFRYSAPAGLTATNTNFTVPVTIINYGENAGSVESIKFISGDGRNTGNDSISLSGINVGATSVKNHVLDLSAFSGSGTATGVLRITYSGGYKEDKPFSFNYNLPSGARLGKRVLQPSITDDNFSIFPNPTNGVFSITSKNNVIPKYVSVYNLNGVLMDVKGSVNEIDLSNLSEGLYTIRIETENGFTDKKIIKQ
ncbi:MAG: T9SS type A sorting domain-containing protein [Sphingobacteriales bacterium]|nr:T9SS type A sorting domain-containing protein [Sphingobacteriales bacterium]